MQLTVYFDPLLLYAERHFRPPKPDPESRTGYEAEMSRWEHYHNFDVWPREEPGEPSVYFHFGGKS